MKDYLEELRNDHSNFNKNKLERPEFENPFNLFDIWYKEAFDKEISEVNAFLLSTADKKFQPSARVVYLKEFANQEFVFYTNYLSKKGEDIEQNPLVSAVFFWKELERQVRISGKAVKISEERSDSYFASRPRESQLGAWASNQSEVLKSRDELDEKIKEFDDKFPDFIPRPNFWGGYAIQAQEIEFWQGRKSRLHDRFVFEKQPDDSWKIKRLNP